MIIQKVKKNAIYVKEQECAIEFNTSLKFE